MLVAACQESGDNACEHISASGRCHTGISRGVEDDISIGQAEGGVVALQYDIGVQVLGHIASF